MRSKANCKPVDLPIQLACISRTFSGQSFERVDGLQQLLGEVADLEEPLGQLAPLDLGAGAPALAVDHLLVGEHGHVDRIPVHHRVLAVDEARIEHVDEHAPAAGRNTPGRRWRTPAPVEAEAQRLHLRDHRVDVVVGPGLRVPAGRHRRVFRRHAEGVTAHRVQHVVARRQLVARHHVAHRVVAHVADMDAARGVGKHLEHVVLRPGRVGLGLEGAGLFPGFLPFRLDGTRVVAGHIGLRK